MGNYTGPEFSTRRTVVESGHTRRRACASCGYILEADDLAYEPLSGYRAKLRAMPQNLMAEDLICVECTVDEKGEWAGQAWRR